LNKIKNWIVEPRHGFFAKDARGWFAGTGNHGNSLPWLYPTTLRGAICSAIGREIEQQHGRIFASDEWLALKGSLMLRQALAVRMPIGKSFSLEHRVWPAPADAVYLQGNHKPVRLLARPAEVSIWDSSDDPRTRALHLLTLAEGAGNADAKPQRGPIWWTETEFVDWLCNTATAGPSANHSSSRQPLARNDIHVKMNAERDTAEAGFLWGNEFRETLTKGTGIDPSHTDVSNASVVFRWAFGVSISIGREDAAAVTPQTALLAGDRNLASMTPVEEIAQFPMKYQAALQANPSLKRLRLYAIAPTVFKNGWCPDGFAINQDDLVGTLPGIEGTVRLVAAAVGRPVPISGWDLAVSESSSGNVPRDRPKHSSGAPRNTQLACPAGSTWIVERVDRQPFNQADVRSLWLSTWGQGAADGLGVLVAGLDPTY